MADGPIKVASTYSIGNGRTVSGLLTKDTTAPSAPRSSVAPGSYTSTQNVALSAAEGTIRYTTDGSQPTSLSASYSKPISVSSSQTIKAVAIDAAGNASDVSSFGYAIGAVAAPRPIVTSLVLPKLKVESRIRMSISPDCRTVKRAFTLVPTYLTFSGSPSTAVAMARQ